MARLNADAIKVQKEFLPVGVKLAALRHEMLQIGAYQAMRYLDQAAEVYHEDVQRIIEMRGKG